MCIYIYIYIYIHTYDPVCPSSDRLVSIPLDETDGEAVVGRRIHTDGIRGELSYLVIYIIYCSSVVSYSNISLSLYIYIYVCMYVYLSLSIYIYIHISIYVYTYVYIYI